MKFRKRYIIIVSILLLLSFALFSRYIKRGGMKDIDFAVSVKIQERIDKSSRLRTAAIVSNIMEGSTFFASPEFSVILLIFLTLITTFDYRKRKINWKGLAIPLLFGFLVFSEIYGKTVVHHPAPPFFMIKNPVTVFPKYYINDEYSYPSGHAARATFLSIMIFLTIIRLHSQTLRNRMALAIGFVCLIYTVLVSISRIYLGHHWLSDVFGGWLLGLGFGILVILLLQNNSPEIQTEKLN